MEKKKLIVFAIALEECFLFHSNSRLVVLRRGVTVETS